MGYAEFGGGGSVKWEIEYDNKHGSSVDKDPPANKLKGRGTDKDPDAAVGRKLYVQCTEAKVVSTTNGTVIVEITLSSKSRQVYVAWGSHVSPELEALSADTTT
jgi:hypothetical protein